MVTGLCELALKARDPERLARCYTESFGLDELSRDHERIWLSAGPVKHDGGDRSLYVSDPEGNIVEAWDHFERDRSVEDLKR